MHKNQKTILIAVTHSLQEPWISIAKEGQFKTWLLEEHANTEVKHFYTKPINNVSVKIGDANEFLRWRSGRRVGQARNLISGIVLSPLKYWVPKVTRTDNDEFHLGVDTFRIQSIDAMQFSRWKRLSVVKYFLENSNADYLLMTTSSSYVQPNLLLRKLARIEETNLYAGPLINPGNDGFVSGAQTVLNRASASMLVKNRMKIPVSLLDDVAIGRTFRKLGVPISELDTMNIGSLNELREIPRELLLNTHHFRLKSQSGKKRNDVEIFEALHQILKEK
jgi:hypothetical protein